ncbi:CbtA family protein [Rhodococcus sp. UNC363MFTsu5.1]|uniref:CbtA family protein n=1 Tax=Rhodococcus sp. UNC363MFTsu5.1 TaxID=1449069 RepID=UPI0004873F5A|nr:CbtA family protein [Rhodococcus sp. UNC363MFTsu5.1]
MPLTGTFTNLLIRGLLAGLVAGLLAGAVAFVIGEPHINAAIAIEEAASAPAEEHTHDAATTDEHPHDSGGAAEEGHSHGDDALVSRDGQRAGLFLATSLAGLALGAIFAAVAHYARRVTALSGPVLALALAGLGWLAIEAVPFFKYPANPPAVGDPDTINQRTWLWLASVVLGLFAVAVAAYVARLVASTGYLSVQVAAPLLAFLAIVAIGYVVLPGINEVGDDFPATLLWEFRISSLAIQATLWLALGLGFAFLTERAAKASSRSEALTTR